MADKKKKTYKDEHGTSRVGDFLRSIGKGDILKTVVGIAGGIATGGGLNAIIGAISGNKELTIDQQEYALKMAELDFKEQEEVTKRWQSDMASDSKLSKAIRPATLIVLTSALLLFITLDSSLESFSVDAAYIDMLKFLLGMVYGAYFGGRSAEKIAKIVKNI